MRHATSLSGNHNVAATVTALGSVFDTLCYARTVLKKKKNPPVHRTLAMAFRDFILL